MARPGRYLGGSLVCSISLLSTETRIKCANFEPCCKCNLYAAEVQQRRERRRRSRGTSKQETRPLHHAVLAKREASGAVACVPCCCTGECNKAATARGIPRCRPARPVWSAIVLAARACASLMQQTLSIGNRSRALSSLPQPPQLSSSHLCDGFDFNLRRMFALIAGMLIHNS